MPKELLYGHSDICSYQEYLRIWEPTVDEMYALKQNPQNEEDLSAVSIVRQNLDWQNCLATIFLP